MIPNSLASVWLCAHFFNHARDARYMLQDFQQLVWIRSPRDLVIGAARAGRVNPFVEN